MEAVQHYAGLAAKSSGKHIKSLGEAGYKYFSSQVRLYQSESRGLQSFLTRQHASCHMSPLHGTLYASSLSYKKEPFKISCKLFGLILIRWCNRASISHSANWRKSVTSLMLDGILNYRLTAGGAITVWLPAALLQVPLRRRMMQMLQGLSLSGIKNSLPAFIGKST